MKITFKTLLVGVVLIGLTACNDKGSDNKDVAIPGLPAGRVNANGVDQNRYCDIAQDQRSVTCATVTPLGNGQNQSCVTPAIAYSDINSMCLGLQNIISKNTGGMGANDCGRIAMNYLYNQRCNGINSQNIPNTNLPQNNGGNWIPGQNQNSDLRAIRCSYEASRAKGIGFVGDKSQDYYLVDGSTKNLRSTGFLDLAKFIGTIDVSYDKRTDLVTISSHQVDRSINITQTGFAGQEVRLEVQSDDQSLKYVVSCVDAGQQRVISRNLTNYSCVGTSNLSGRTEKINRDIDVNALLDGDIQLGDSLVMSVNEGSSGLDNAVITLTASGIAKDHTVISSAYLNSVAQIKIKDNLNVVDVSCRPKR